MMPAVISSSSKNRATPVIGAPVIASCREPTSGSPDSRPRCRLPIRLRRCGLETEAVGRHLGDDGRRAHGDETADDLLEEHRVRGG